MSVVVHASNLGQCTCEQARNGGINQDREALVPGQREERRDIRLLNGGFLQVKRGTWSFQSTSTIMLFVGLLIADTFNFFFSVPASSQNSKQAAGPAVILISMKAS